MVVELTGRRYLINNAGHTASNTGLWQTQSHDMHARVKAGVALVSVIFNFAKFLCYEIEVNVYRSIY